ncbi:MAG: Lrp/AsnC family transcriptional regulator [Propionivibrio sp.]|uniref:siroheme decarboxylase n=1 Tax=Candidatus Propionivibrio dominans TaxID=2954373 RepID=A0A9D7I783_9RHOO|nr:Lrp/AsnC family transcriptional regulator [Candidatus Propionivibrio dominans]
MREQALDYRLLNDFQRNFPLCQAPFAELAATLGVAEGAVLRMLEQLRRDGKIARVGAVFAPNRIGVSTLAAMAVAPEKLRIVADTISRFAEVNHNYEREHRYNLWFVVIAGSEGRLQAALGAIEEAAGYPMLKLPLVQEYHIDLGFPLDGQSEKRRVPVPPVTPFTPPTPLGELERRLVMALQEGLPLFIRPFQILASRVGCDESEVLERIGRWCEEGIIKRFGVVVRHHELGYKANAMLVQDIPDALIGEIAATLAHEPGVTLCYQSPRVLPEWPYNLFCMIHGQVRDEVEAKIAELRTRLKLTGYAHDTLFSITRFKQTGARYA